MEGAGKAAADGAGHGCISCEARAGGRKENLAPALCPEPAQPQGPGQACAALGPREPGRDSGQDAALSRKQGG